MIYYGYMNVNQLFYFYILIKFLILIIMFTIIINKKLVKNQKKNIIKIYKN